MHICRCNAININKKIHMGKLRPVQKVKNNRRDSEKTLRIGRILLGPILGNTQPTRKPLDKRRGFRCQDDSSLIRNKEELTNGNT